MNGMWRWILSGLLMLTAGVAAAVQLPGPLVESGWLAEHLDEVVVLDVRDDPASFTRQARLGRNKKTGALRILQLGAHIPGARLIDFKWVTAPRVVDAGLGVVATLFAIALTGVYNRTAAGEMESQTATL